MRARDAWAAPLQRYWARVVLRLRNGQREYGDTATTRDPLELCREIRDELADLAGWAVWLDDRVRVVEERLTALRVELQRYDGEIEI